MPDAPWHSENPKRLAVVGYPRSLAGQIGVVAVGEAAGIGALAFDTQGDVQNVGSDARASLISQFAKACIGPSLNRIGSGRMRQKVLEID